MDLKKFSWNRQPKAFVLGEDALAVTTLPHTDLWQRTYYHFRNDNAPCFQAKAEERFFTFSVRTDFAAAHHRFDQCGIIVYVDDENWMKASVEYENADFAHLGSVVTNGGYSDWATLEIPSTVKSVHYRLSRREDDFRIEASFDGVRYFQIRIAHFFKAKGALPFGVYACSPEDSSFVARFSDFRFGPCLWERHDGQQPDAPEKEAKE